MTDGSFYLVAYNDKIKEAREKLGFTQADLASLLNTRIGRKFTRGYMSHIENGTRGIKPEFALSLCKILKIKLEDTFYEKD